MRPLILAAADAAKEDSIRSYRISLGIASASAVVLGLMLIFRGAPARDSAAPTNALLHATKPASPDAAMFPSASPAASPQRLALPASVDCSSCVWGQGHEFNEPGIRCFKRNDSCRSDALDDSSEC